MITREEIIAVADETGLTPPVVEKDYVLGWLLAAVNAHDVFSGSWVFKGGTCLKKCYFETYRFSEDLDFTLRDAVHLDEDFLKEQFAGIAEWIYEAAGIELPVDRCVFDVYQNPRGHKSCEGRVYYQSHFTGGQRNIPKIKFDLTADEILVMPPSRQIVFHPHSDNPDGGIHIDCYDYPEVFAEKVRALGERGRPRDLYDVINIYRNDHLPASAVVRDVLKQKCDYKDISIPVIRDMDAYQDDLHRNWKPMLAHQLPALPDLDAYWQSLPDFFDWLEGRRAEEAPALGAITQSDAVYRPQYGQIGLRTLSGNSLEIIRFAAANRLCVHLDYTDQQGRRRSRIIEPYSLRRAGNGNILLYAVRSEDGEVRAYRIERINDASMTNQVFVPRYEVELNPHGVSLPIPASGGSASSPGLPNQPFGTSAIKRRSQPERRSSGFSTGPTYAYRCRLCDKTFKRKTQSPKLKSHKDKNGWPCSGRTGYYEDTIY